MKLSILIPTTESRRNMTMELVDKILDQIERGNYIGIVEVVALYDNGEKSIGAKRNELVRLSKGEYVCFVDSDDDLATNYIDLVMDGIELGVDCCSLRGVITWDGENPQIFEHSIKYNEWKTNDLGAIKYERFINHLNVVKKSIASQIKFQEISHGEDRIWSESLQKSGLIKTEHFIDSVIYHYLFLTNK